MSKNCHEMMRNWETDEAKKVIFDELEYNPENGMFRWKKTGGMRRRPSHWFRGGKTDGYLIVRINKRAWKAHRVAWLLNTGDWPTGQIDHDDGERSNNVFTNLSDVPPSVNAKNKAITSANKSGVMGVHKRKDEVRYKNPWIAFIKVGGKRRHLGCFSTFDEAASARRAAETEYGFHRNHGRKDTQCK